MLELFQILDSIPACNGLDTVVRLIKDGIIPIVQIFIPILLIVFGTIDLGKAVISSDDKEVKAAQGRLIKRIIYAVLIFFIVTFVTVVMNLVGTAGEDGGSAWWECYEKV